MLRKMSGLFLNKYQKERLAEICPDWLFAMITNRRNKDINIYRVEGDWYIITVIRIRYGNYLGDSANIV